MSERVSDLPTCFGFVLHTNASSHGLGAVLEQEQGDGLFHLPLLAERSPSTRSGMASLFRGPHHDV